MIIVKGKTQRCLDLWAVGESPEGTCWTYQDVGQCLHERYPRGGMVQKSFSKELWKRQATNPFYWIPIVHMKLRNY